MLVGLLHIGRRQSSAQFIAQQLEQKNYKIKHIDFTDFKTNHAVVDGLSVLIVNMVNEDEAIELLLDYLSEYDSPIIFNEAEKSNLLSGDEKSRWLRHILHKIDGINALLPVDDGATVDNMHNEKGLSHWGIKNVWILCSGIGGQESVKRFLESFKGTSHVLFLIVQVIEEEFMLMFSRQMQESLSMKVKCGTAEVVKNETMSFLLTPGQMIDCDFSSAHIKAVDLNNKSKHDMGADLLALGEQMIKDYRVIPNLVIFDGMHLAAKSLADMVEGHQGEVLVQAKESCVIQPGDLALQALSHHQQMKPEDMAQSIVNAMA